MCFNGPRAAIGSQLNQPAVNLESNLVMSHFPTGLMTSKKLLLLYAHKSISSLHTTHLIDPGSTDLKQTTLKNNFSAEYPISSARRKRHPSSPPFQSLVLSQDLQKKTKYSTLLSRRLGFPTFFCYRNVLGHRRLPDAISIDHIL